MPRLLTFACAFYLLTPLLSLAANFSATPLALNLDVARRDIVSETITLTNTTNRQIRLYASVNEVATDGEGALQSFTQPSMSDRRNSPTSWFAVTRGRIELAPGEVREVPITITMNPQTEPGNYSVFVGFAEASNEPQARQKVMSGNGEGTLVNLRVDQTQNQFLRLARYNVERFVSGNDGVVVEYELQNPGQIDVVPGGELVLYDLRGNELSAHDLNQAGVAIAPGETQAFTETIPEPENIGKYKAFITIEYGSSVSSALTDTAFFYVFPLWQLIALFVILLTVTLVVTVLLHRRLSPVGEPDDQVAMYIRRDVSPTMEHDIDLKQSAPDQWSPNESDNEIR